jgi:hypothetical protein
VVAWRSCHLPVSRSQEWKACLHKRQNQLSSAISPPSKKRGEGRWHRHRHGPYVIARLTAGLALHFRKPRDGLRFIERQRKSCKTTICVHIHGKDVLLVEGRFRA